MSRAQLGEQRRFLGCSWLSPWLVTSSGRSPRTRSEETCVIYGMPKAAVEASVVDRAGPLSRMADKILAAV